MEDHSAHIARLLEIGVIDESQLVRHEGRAGFRDAAARPPPG
ncbi:hypothetical protein [Streptomyces sparsus]